jgi:hypothetical protein
MKLMTRHKDKSLLKKGNRPLVYVLLKHQFAYPECDVNYYYSPCYNAGDPKKEEHQIGFIAITGNTINFQTYHNWATPNILVTSEQLAQLPSPAIFGLE